MRVRTTGKVKMARGSIQTIFGGIRDEAEKPIASPYHSQSTFKSRGGVDPLILPGGGVL